MSGVLHRDVIDSGLPWAQFNYTNRDWAVGEECWALAPPDKTHGERYWYAAVIAGDSIPGVPYVEVEFLEGPILVRRHIIFAADVRDDLADGAI